MSSFGSSTAAAASCASGVTGLGGSSYRSTGVHQFSISESDFQRGSLLKRRRQESPPRMANGNMPPRSTYRSKSSALQAEPPAQPSDIAFRQRSKSKSRARAMASKPRQEFIALGRNDSARPLFTRQSSTISNTSSHGYRSTATRERSYSAEHRRPHDHSHAAPLSSSYDPLPSRYAREKSSYVDRSGSKRKERSPSPVASRGRYFRSDRHQSSPSRYRNSHSRSSANSRDRSQLRHISDRTRSKSKPRSSHDQEASSYEPVAAPSSAAPPSSSASSRQQPPPASTVSKAAAAAPRQPIKVPTPGAAMARPREPVQVVTNSSRPAASNGSRPSTSTPAPAAINTAGIDWEMERTHQQLAAANQELKQMENELSDVMKRIQAKKYQVMDLQLVLDGLAKRKDLQTQYLGNTPNGSSFSMSTSTTTTSAPVVANVVPPTVTPQTRAPTVVASRARRSSSKAPASKRPRIVDEEDEDDSASEEEKDDDDDVVIIEQVQIKEETPKTKKASKSKSKAKTPAPVTVVPPKMAAKSMQTSTVLADYFWGKIETPKLLVQHRAKLTPDGSARKGRNLAFNPKNTDYFATTSDDGGLIMWKYDRSKQEVSKDASFDPISFRKESQCAESIAWSPDGQRLAMAFRDPLRGEGEFCVVRLDQLELKDPAIPQIISERRIMRRSTTLHSRGISAIEWVPSGSGDDVTSSSLITAGSDHAVMLWDEYVTPTGSVDLKWKVLHREHRSEVKTVCVHSQRNAVFTGGLDGLLLRYDMHKMETQTIMERRKPSISKINAVLEHPHNPNVLLVSSVEQAEHSILLHDLRQRYAEHRDSTMTLTWIKSSDAKSMSQYIVPRWSPAGLHVSCGSKSGVVNIWDIRVRGPKYPLVYPQQALRVHRTLQLFVSCLPCCSCADYLTDPQKKWCSTPRGIHATTPCSQSPRIGTSGCSPFGSVQ